MKKKNQRAPKPIPELGSLIYDSIAGVTGLVVYVGDGWVAYEFAAGAPGHPGYGCQSFQSVEINPDFPSVIRPDPFYIVRERIRQEVYAARAAAKKARMGRACEHELENLDSAWDSITTALDFLGDTYNGRGKGGAA